MNRRTLTAAASLLVLVACGGDDKLTGASNPDAGQAPPPKAAPPSAAGVAVDPALPAWEPAKDLSGNLASAGSSTMAGLMALWGQAFSGAHAGVKVKSEGKGSSTAPAALADGTAQIAAMSRPMRPAEMEAFEKKHGGKPIEVKAALDAVAILVHKDNPLAKLTLTQVDAVFSTTRKLGGAKELKTWGDLGLTGDWAARPISVHGRGSASGTQAFFKEKALKNGELKDGVKEHAGSAALVQAVASDLYAIGYGGIGDRTPGVKVVPLVTETGAASSGSYDDVVKGAYPLSRPLYLYAGRAAGKPIDPVAADFLRLVLSRQGQEAVAKDGYLPLTAAAAQQERAKLQ